jgi:hypothetical protein
MNFFQALFSQKKIDGTLEHAEIDRLRNRAKKRLASNLPEKHEVCRSGYARRELRDCARRNNNRSYHQQYNDNGDEDHDNCDHGHGGCRLGREERKRNNKKKGDRVATEERGKRCKGNNRQATRSKKTWAQHDER